MVQWEEMKGAGFVPQIAKGVEHERATVFNCAIPTMVYLIGIASIYAGCLRYFSSSEAMPILNPL